MIAKFKKSGVPMADRSVFEIIGPIMIGPSSSHTAGAVRIGTFARAFLDERPVVAEIVLYGSFAETYRGHGTDRALVAGILGMSTADERIKSALDIAHESGLKIEFIIKENGENHSGKSEIHPNTAKIKLAGISGRVISIVGSSLGGGKIAIYRINKYEVNLSGRKFMLLVEHHDKPGTIGRVTTLLGNCGINIGSMRLPSFNHIKVSL